MEILQEIKHLVEKELQLNLDNKTRKREYVFARAVYYRLCSEFTKHSLNAIGETINKDHSTVIHGLKIFKSFLDFPNMYQAEINAYDNIHPTLKKISTEIKEEAPETILERFAREKQEMTNERNNSIEKYNTLKDKHNKLLKYFSKFEKNAYEKYAEL